MLCFGRGKRQWLREQDEGARESGEAGEKTGEVATMTQAEEKKERKNPPERSKIKIN